MKSTDIENLYGKAVEVVKTTRRASLTHLQRQLNVSYQDAAQLIDLLEERGVVGPASETSPREVLLPSE
jgi:S-DNA-T family DNA segregation ATPase FtsK/SpoIIIE